MLKRYCWLLVIAFIASGCAIARHAVPADQLNMVSIYGMRDVRTFGGSPSDSFKQDFMRLLEQDGKKVPGFFDFKTPRMDSMLAISGGGANGAYGAGLLSGWSQAGTRPEFRVVTGISTGAIIAPFAFLGSCRDSTIKEFYTKYSTRDLVRLRIPFSNSFASVQPLERLINKYFDAALLRDIAAEYNKGRRLYVGTTNLDAQKLVIWDMGKIAAIGDENALKLFRKILLASASIPIAFPPVYMQAQVNDRDYEEMHVDGGISKQVFFLYDVLQGVEKAFKEKNIDISRIKYQIYIIRNGYVDSLYQEVPDKIVAIAARTVDTMTNAQSIGDLYQLYIFARENRGDFNLAYIPATHVSKAKEPFDRAEMKALFDLGFSEALKGYEWKKAPPGIDNPQ
jgi:predicted patatin/cPLA2 family phospholipase